MIISYPKLDHSTSFVCLCVCVCMLVRVHEFVRMFMCVSVRAQVIDMLVLVLCLIQMTGEKQKLFLIDSSHNGSMATVNQRHFQLLVQVSTNLAIPKTN